MSDSLYYQTSNNHVMGNLDQAKEKKENLISYSICE